MTNPGEQPFDNYATAVTPATSFEIPGFRIIGELGRGAFGVVYQAHDITLDRPVAIKVALVDEPSRREEYIQEAQKAAKLTVEGVVPVYQVGRLDNGMPFVVQMLLEGGTLRQEMKRPGGIAPKRICELMIRIAQVVAQAHALGLIHRDLKPDNILLDKRGQPWVADFGLALSESDQRLHKGEKAGTPIYMSPEQVQGRAEWLDGRADIYALGIIFYELLVGRPPFTARSRQELEEEILHRDPKPLTQYLTGIPGEFDLIFRRCCAKQTNDRYANALDLVRDLEDVHQSINYGDVHLIESARASHGFASSRYFNNSTRRNSTKQTERNQVPSATPKLLTWLAISVGVLGAIALVVLNYERLFLGNLPGPIGKNEVPSVEPVPVRPAILRVSQDPKSGGLRTISEALKLAHRGETITIEKGKYEENLIIDQDVELVGDETARATIVASGPGDTVAITGNAHVTFRHLNLDNMNKDANTIHVKQGSLNVDSCAVFASSFNCVRSLASPSIKLSRSEFRNGAHEAVYVEGVKTLWIDQCAFAINVSSFGGTGQHPYGIQAVQSSGRISGTTFDERGQRGVYWKDASGPVVLENNRFNSCDYPIQLDNVMDATIQGENILVDCKNGIELQDSAVSITGLKMQGTGKAKSSGIRIYTDKKKPELSRTRITISDSLLQKFEQGLNVVDKSIEIVLRDVSFVENETGVNFETAQKATLQRCSVSKCTIGMMLEDCTAELTDCTFNEVRLGVSQTTPFPSRGLLCERSVFQFGGPNSIALLLKSGSAELRNSRFHTMGIVALLDDAASGPKPRKLDVSSPTIEDCPHWIFAKAPGEVSIDDEKLEVRADPKRLKVDRKSSKRFTIMPLSP